MAGTWLDQNHPEWLLHRADPNDPNILFNYANPEALEWMTMHKQDNQGVGR